MLEAQGGNQGMSYVIVGGICLFVGTFLGVMIMCLVAINNTQEDHKE